MRRLAPAAAALRVAGAVVVRPGAAVVARGPPPPGFLQTAPSFVQTALVALDTPALLVYGGVAFLLLSVIVAVVLVMRCRGGDKEEGDEGAADEARDEAAEAGEATPPAQPGPVPFATRTQRHLEMKEQVDFERLLKLLAKRTAQQVGPKVAKVHSVRGVLMAHLLNLRESITNFVRDEALSTVGMVLREAGAEEFMLLLNPGKSAMGSLPPASILLAGLLSPVVLSVSLIIHVTQVALVLLPTLLLCTWAIYNDRKTLPDCAVPGLRLWVYVQAGMALLLTTGHLMMTMNIQRSKRLINSKIEGMKERLKEAVSDGELSIGEIREMLIIVSILLENSLVEEDKLRRSPWRSLIGYGTIVWMLTVLWTFFLVTVFTFVPGTIAFHPAAARVAGETFCGAWATVFTVRLTCVLSLLFQMFNMLSVIQFISDRLVIMESSSVITQAKKFDQSTLGLPVVETLVKAFLLRGTAGSLKSQIAMSRGESEALEQQREALASRIEELTRRIQLYGTEAAVLKREAGLEDDDAAAAEIVKNESVKTEVARARLLEKATREEIDALYGKMLHAAARMRNQGLQALVAADDGAPAQPAAASSGSPRKGSPRRRWSVA